MKLSKEQKTILHKLLDKYEQSATFRGVNKVAQRFQVKPDMLFPRYRDDAEYDFYVYLNEEMQALEDAGFVRVQKERGMVQKIWLEEAALPEIYKVLGRISKADLIGELTAFFERKQEKLKERSVCQEEVVRALHSYIEAQKTRLSDGRLPEYFEDFKEYQELWKCLHYLTESDEEVYVRDLSVRLYQDSKRLENLQGKLLSLLDRYGTFPEKETILEECGVIRNPSYVMVKGAVRLKLAGQELDLSKLSGDLAFSSGAVSDISSVQLSGGRFLTIENLTTFHRFAGDADTAVVYLGGYHNRIRRDFLKKVYAENPDATYLHFGDIDAGGFYIYEHLRRMTGIPFRAWRMDRHTLAAFRERAGKLTANDEKRLMRLKDFYCSEAADHPQREEILQTLAYMLEHKIKLEQEAIDL